MQIGQESGNFMINNLSKYMFTQQIGSTDLNFGLIKSIDVNSIIDNIGYKSNNWWKCIIPLCAVMKSWNSLDIIALKLNGKVKIAKQNYPPLPKNVRS